MSGTLSPTTPTGRRIAGITSFTVDGTVYQVTEFSWDPGTVSRETMTSLSGVDGYKELPKSASISGKFRDNSAISISSFYAKTNSTVVVQLANGKSIVGHNLWYVGEAGASGAEATFDFKFEGVSGTIMEIGGPTS